MSSIHSPTLTLQEVLLKYQAGPTDGLFTDGSARPNPGPGGWAAVLVKDGEMVSQCYGQHEATTNNRMELTALIEGYKILDPTVAVDIFTDSELCVNTINKWAASWERNNWRRKSGPIANLELVQELYTLSKEKPKASLKWIKAHNGWRWNEYADSLSTAWTRETL